MKVLGIRFCKVAKAEDAQAIAAVLGENGLGLKTTNMGQSEVFNGAVFPVGDAPLGEGSWIELWPTDENMPEMTMLQIVVDDSDAFAERAKEKGVDVKGPDDAHGERIYYIAGAGGFPIAFVSKVK
ncbi:VOC family protein [Hyphococcus lacteus]|uniref:VOC domain-containing protein n=1 Tax=Hyphococcus lacteus TaxID=3143536 RepID=A0ABV3Z2N7_9PROT